MDARVLANPGGRYSDEVLRRLAVMIIHGGFGRKNGGMNLRNADSRSAG